MRRRPTILLIGVLCLLLAPLAAAAQDGVSMDSKGGYDGYFKVNSWMPVRVVVENTGPGIEGQIVVTPPDGTEDAIYAQRASLPTQSRKQFVLYTFAQYSSRQLEVRLVEEGKIRAEQTLRLHSLGDRDFLYGIVGDDPSALGYLAALPPRGGRRTYVAHLDLADLPAQGQALTGMDMLVIHGVDTSSLRADQRDALRGWVAMGGHLVICGGPNALRTAAGLGDLVPVTIDGTETTVPSELGDYAGAPFIAQIPAVVARVTPREGAQVLAGAPGLPLLVRRTLDSGMVDYVAVDPGLEPMHSWIGNDNFWTELTFDTTLLERLGTNTNMGPSNLLHALGNVASIAVPSVLLFAGFLFLYVLVVGPLNFYVLRRVDRRALAWVTVPVLVVVFSCAAYLIGVLSRGRKVVASEVSVIIQQTESRTAVVDALVGLYSPSRRAYDVRLPDNVLVSNPPPMPYAPGGITSRELIVEQGPPTYLRDLGIDVGEMRAFQQEAVAPWQGVEADLVLSSNGGKHHLEGTVTNHSDSAVRDPALVFEVQVVRIPDLGAGETRTLSIDLKSGYYLPSYRLIEELLNAPSIGTAGRREHERRREVLYSVLQYGQGGYWNAVRGQGGMTLLGWLSDSPLPVEVVDTPTTAHVTALLFAPLSFTPSDPNTVVVPLRSMDWHYIGTGYAGTPYELYGSPTDEVYVFRLPSRAHGLPIEELVLHVDGMDSLQSGRLPTVSLKDMETGTWEPVSPLAWGANEVAAPERYVDDEGNVEVKVHANTIERPVSVDFSAILQKPD